MRGPLSPKSWYRASPTILAYGSIRLIFEALHGVPDASEGMGTDLGEPEKFHPRPHLVSLPAFDPCGLGTTQ